MQKKRECLRELEYHQSKHARSYSGPHFSRIFPHLGNISPYSVRMWENPGKMNRIIGPE